MSEPNPSRGLPALHPEIFAIAEQCRARDPRPGAVRIRNIRVGVDEQGRGGTLVAGKMPEPDPPHIVAAVLHGTAPDNLATPKPAEPYRGKAR